MKQKKKQQQQKKKTHLRDFLGIKNKQSSIALDPISFLNSTACLRAAGRTKNYAIIRQLKSRCSNERR